MARSSTPRTRWSTLSVGAAAALMLIAGCSKTETPVATTTPPANTGSSTPGSTSAPATSAPGTTAPKGTTTTKPDPKADEAAAEASVLTIADLPDDFAEGEASADTDDDSPYIGVAECADFEDAMKASDEAETAKVKVTFGDAETGTELNNNVSVYDDVEVVKANAEVLADGGFATCLEVAFGEALVETLPATATVDSVTVTRNEEITAEDYGVDSLDAFLVEVTVTTADGTESFTIATVFYTSGRALGELTGQSSTSALAQAILVETIETATGNLVDNAPS